MATIYSTRAYKVHYKELSTPIPCQQTHPYTPTPPHPHTFAWSRVLLPPDESEQCSISDAVVFEYVDPLPHPLSLHGNVLVSQDLLTSGRLHKHQIH